MLKPNTKIIDTFKKINFITFSTAIIVFLLDQFIKFIIKQKFYLHETLPVFENFFHITYVQNFGAALGILKGKSVFLILAAIISIIILILYSQLLKTKDVIYKLALGLLMGGALGNLYDRILLGYVLDYFDVRFFPAIFNLADIFINSGVIYLFYRVIINNNEETIWPQFITSEKRYIN